MSTIQSQPSSVGIDSKGNVIVFHRADRWVVHIKFDSFCNTKPNFNHNSSAWGYNTFGMDNRLANPDIGPIGESTIVLFDANDNRVINKGGQNMQVSFGKVGKIWNLITSFEIYFRFYLPHGLTIDQEDCLWVTDVGAHQVFKLTPLKENTHTLEVSRVVCWEDQFFLSFTFSTGFPSFVW